MSLHSVQTTLRFLFLLLLSQNGFLQAQTTLNFGTPFFGEISVTGETDLFEFDGIAGEYILLRMSDVMGTDFNPKLVIMGPDGNELNSIAHSQTAEIGFLLPLAGTYSVIASEDGNDHTGEYILFAVSSLNSGSTIISEFGVPILDSIDLPGEVHIYTFLIDDAIDQQSIIIRMSEIISNVFTPKIIIFTPDGEVLAQDVNAFTAESVFIAEQPGTYTVWAMEDGGNTTGAYSFFIQKSKNPGNVTNMAFGESVVDSLNQLGELRTYTFNIDDAIGQQSIIIRMSEIISNAFTPKIMVFTPQGDQLSQNVNAFTAESVFIAEQPGTYTVWAMEDGGNTTGAYSFRVQKSKNPGNGIKTAFGETVVDSLEQLGELRTYTFNIDDAIGQQSIIIRMSEIVSSPFTPKILVFDPEGNKLAQEANSITSEFIFVPEQPGMYTVWAMEDGGNTAGEYSFIVQCSKNSGNTISVNFGIFVNDSLRQFGEIHTYSFVVSDTIGQQNIVIRMSETTPNPFTPNIVVFDPQGNQLAQDVNSVTSEVVLVTEQSGTYTIWAMEDGGNTTAAYGFIVQKSKNPGNPNAILRRWVVTDSITALGNIHTYIFNYTDNPEEVTFRIEDLDNSLFSPQLYIFDPAGVLIKEESHSQLLEMKIIPQENGTYTIWATDFGGDNIGRYQLSYDFSGTVQVKDKLKITPTKFLLSQNFPNPFNPTTTIRFELPEMNHVNLDVFNIKGQKVRTLIDNRRMETGYHAIEWSGEDDRGLPLSSGLYIYKMKAGTHRAVMSMVFLK